MKNIIGTIILCFLFANCQKGIFEDSTENAKQVIQTNITISSPQDNMSTSSDTIEVSGSAEDTSSSGINRIEVKTNQGFWTSAQGTYNWKMNLTLATGLNTIVARVVTNRGFIKESDPVYIYYNLVKRSELTTPLSHASVLYYQNKFYIIGGFLYDSISIPSLSTFYSFTTNPVQLTSLPNLDDPGFMSIVYVYNNHIYVMSGFYIKNKTLLNKTFIYDLNGNQTGETALNINYSRGGAAYCADYVNNKLYIIGGYGWNGSDLEMKNTILIYDMAAATWETKQFTGLYQAYSRALYNNGYVYIFGGQDQSGDFLRTVKTYQISSELLTSADKLVFYRAGMGIGFLNNNVYIIGGKGYQNPGDAKELLKTTEIYNLTTGLSAQDKDIPAGLNYPAIASDGTNIYLFGGRNEEDFPTSNIYQYIH